MNHYERLGVSPTADLAVIRAAYRVRVAAAHPDRAQGTLDERRRTAETAAMNAAYAVLADPARRAEYDLSLKREAPAAPPSTPRTGSARPPRAASPAPNERWGEPARSHASARRTGLPHLPQLGGWLMSDPTGQWAAVALLGLASLLPIPFGGGIFASLGFFASAVVPLVIAQWAVSRRFFGAPVGLVGGALFALLRALSPIRIR